MGLFQKSLLLWFLFAGLHLVLTRLCEWQQELDEGDEEEVFFRLLSRVAPLRLASQGLCVVWGPESGDSVGFYLNEALKS